MRAAWLALAAVLAACDPEAGPAPVFPADYAATYEVLWPCRSSVEHQLHHVVILADPATAAAYRSKSTLPAGGVVVKEEYLDEACSRRVGWTAMQKDGATPTPNGSGWRWQELDENRRVTADGAPATCVSCHARCRVYDLTCALPLDE